MMLLRREVSDIFPSLAARNQPEVEREDELREVVFHLSSSIPGDSPHWPWRIFIVKVPSGIPNRSGRRSVSEMRWLTPIARGTLYTDFLAFWSSTCRHQLVVANNSPLAPTQRRVQQTQFFLRIYPNVIYWPTDALWSNSISATDYPAWQCCRSLECKCEFQNIQNYSAIFKIVLRKSWRKDHLLVVWWEWHPSAWLLY